MKLVDFIICDDIRTEINNKVSLIGVYDDAINFVTQEKAANFWPKGIRLGIFIRLDFVDLEEQNEIGKLVIESTINGEPNLRMEQPLDTKEQKNSLLRRMSISVVFNQISIPKTGDMVLTLSVYNKNNEIMDKFYYPGDIKIAEIIAK